MVRVLLQSKEIIPEEKLSGFKNPHFCSIKPSYRMPTAYKSGKRFASGFRLVSISIFPSVATLKKLPSKIPEYTVCLFWLSKSIRDIFFFFFFCSFFFLLSLFFLNFFFFFFF